MELGVVGLPNVGKSTLFNALTNAGAESANYPFCTIEPNVGVVDVPDERLSVLAELYQTKSVVPAYVKFVDIAGLVKGASKGEGLGNRFLGAIREVEAVLHVVRCFADSNVTHVSGKVDPKEDIEIINTELALADLDTLNKQKDKIEKRIKAGDKDAVIEKLCIEKIESNLSKGTPARAISFSDAEKDFVKTLFLLTYKPVIYVCNISESDISKNPNDIYEVQIVKNIAKIDNSMVATISAKVEQELSELSEDDRQLFLQDLGLKESGLNQIIKLSYQILGQISFLTAGEKEVRAWTISEGTKAPQAAGKIHSDFEKGFIKAEVVPYPTLATCGGYKQAKEQGKVRIEGKEYIVQDGDVILFRFNV